MGDAVCLMHAWWWRVYFSPIVQSWIDDEKCDNEEDSLSLCCGQGEHDSPSAGEQSVYSFASSPKAAKSRVHSHQHHPNPKGRKSVHSPTPLKTADVLSKEGRGYFISA
eukprot:scaffold314223_cov35-Tisochrysis_lutea.AAC.1